MFNRKNKKNEEKNKQLLTAFDKMVYYIFQEGDDSREEMFKLCDNILNGKPVLANFDKVSVADSNFMLAFISGVVYACEGETIQVGNKLFLFARKEEYEDGSLMQYVEDIK